MARYSRLAVRRITMACLLTGSALAFSEPAAAGWQQPQPGATEPQEIIITARRREEALARAAAPVSAISGNILVERGARLAQDLNAIFPALTVQPTAAGNLIFIRGVGNFTLAANSDPAVGFVSDGVFISRPAGTLAQLFDIDRIELLKGPQGVLYGRNASAGSINVEPRQPVIGAVSARANASIATFERNAEAAVNLPLNDVAAFRLAAAIGNDRPYLAGLGTNNRQYSARAQVKTLLGDRVTVRFSSDFSHAGGASVGSRYTGKYSYDPVAGNYLFADSLLPLSDGLYTAGSQAFRETIFLASAGRNLDSIRSRPWQDSDHYGAHARIDANLGFADLAVIPAWRQARWDVLASSAPFGNRFKATAEQLSLEARLSGRNGAVDWLAGIFLFDDSNDNWSIANLSSILAQLDESYQTASAALFANATVHLSSAFRASGGLRRTRDDKRFSNPRHQSGNHLHSAGRQSQQLPRRSAVPAGRGFQRTSLRDPGRAGNSRPVAGRRRAHRGGGCAQRIHRRRRANRPRRDLAART